MSTIRKRDNKYQVAIRRKGFAPVYRSFHNRSDALEWSRHMEAQADRGDLPKPTKVLDAYRVKDLIERYRDEITVKKRSCDTETYMLDSFLRQPIANLPLSQITSSHFSSYRDKRLKAVKPGTVNRELSIINHAFGIAERDWDIPIKANPLAKLRKLKVNNARTRRLSSDEFDLLLTTAEQSRNKDVVPLIRFALATAMRRGEILRLKWTEIDFTNRTLFIPFTKNGHARTIPISQEAMVVLDELSPYRKERPTVFGMSDNAAKLAWQRLVNRSGIDDLHFHDLRHEANQNAIWRDHAIFGQIA